MGHSEVGIFGCTWDNDVTLTYKQDSNLELKRVYENEAILEIPSIQPNLSKPQPQMLAPRVHY